MLEGALIVAVLVFVYPYLIYPGLLYLLGKRMAVKEVVPAAPAEDPTVAMVICALNEEKVIGLKMENCLAFEYPRDRFRVIVVSDGSTDRTAAIVRQYAASGIELIEQRNRRGKVVNLNEVVPGLREEIVIFSDANVIYRLDAVRKLVGRFEDPTVGCVSGKVVLTDSAPALNTPTGSYYSLEWRMQETSSSIYSMVGADGAMYALRRELFQPCPNDTIIEDFIIPMAVIRQGKRVVHEPEAVGWEKGPASRKEEFRRKVRIAAGSAQGLMRGNAWPPANAPLRFWFIFVSHKLLRWLSPVVGLAALLLALLAIEQTGSRLVLAGFGAVSGLALIQLLTGWGNPVVSAPFYFLFAQAALGWGLLKGIMGQQSVLWAKENR
jgi:cellulose synthase/poly-beta-1,6-N-acetylglucosamine synthase-like glycosyltransferase